MNVFFKIILYCVVLSSSLLYAQSYNINTGGTISTCSGTFYDSGGSGGNYTNNEDYTITFCPSTPGQVIRIVFTSFNTENYNSTYDKLTIYDGNTTSASVIGSYAGSSSPGTINVSGTNSSGCLTFRFRSDAGTIGSGWAATISCVAPPPPIINMANGSYTLCSATFYDGGGSGSNYPHNENKTMVFCPSTPGQCIRAAFSSFDLEDDFDYLSVYDGASSSAPMIVGSSFTDVAPGSVTGTIINSTGCLTFKFYSDPATTASGWAADISCAACVATPTSAVQQDCLGAITICSNQSLAGISLGSGAYNDLNSALGNLGCLNNYGDTDDGSAEHQSHWYYFSPSASGTIGMTIAPTSSSTDYDWAIFGPYVNIPCPPSGTPLRCSAAAPGNSAGAATGLGNGASDTEEGTSGNGWVSTINVIAGQKYILFLDNWNSTSAPYNISWQLTNGASLGCTVLPIELISFKGSNQLNYNLIEWTTSKESNNDYFTLERSRDGVTWNEIQIIDSKGDSHQNKFYHYEDYTFVSNEINYYRLKQTDYNGNIKYSETTISIEAKDNSSITIGSIYPNPTNENIKVDYISSKQSFATIQIIDFTGAQVLSNNVELPTGKNTLTMNINGLRNGVYLFKINENVSGKTYIQKLIKE